MSDRQGAGISIGSTLLILTFSIAALTAFAVLTLVSSNRDYKLAKKNEEMLSAYYRADCRGEEQLRQIDQTLSEFREQAGSKEEYYNLIMEMYGERFDPKEGRLVFKERLNLNLRLNITLQIKDSMTGEENYRILSWNTENYGEYQSDQGIQVWTGED